MFFTLQRIKLKRVIVGSFNADHRVKIKRISVNEANERKCEAVASERLAAANVYVCTRVLVIATRSVWDIAQQLRRQITRLLRVIARANVE